MTAYLATAQIDESAAALKQRQKEPPTVGIILGSGLNSLADSVSEAIRIDFGDVPHFPVSTVEGHVGRVVLGRLEGVPVFVMQGRVHFYEGHGLDHLTLPIRVMHRLGVRVLAVTNAAGGVNPDFEPGDVMLITDHLNLMGMTGHNPLMGPNLDEFGPRFPDMSQAYDRALCESARQAASEGSMGLQEGVYAGLSGPSFESPADLRFLRVAGVDAVGFSTVPEVIVARHCGIRVLGLSGISNKTSLDGSKATTHQEVIEAGSIIGPRIETIIRGVLRRL
jgi:purine-nucleoside phosphorylase